MLGLEDVGCTGFAPIVRVRTIEQTKYEQMWDHPQYRGVAPGEGVATLFLSQAQPKQGASVIDFGAGTGRGSLMLALLGGLHVEMLDFADNCLDPEVRDALQTQSHALKFTQHDLNNPCPYTASYGYCFPAGTPVAGSGKTIDVLQVGDVVLNRDGKPQQVLKLFKKKYTGEMIGLKISGLPEVEMTAEHPVLVSTVRRVHRAKGIHEWCASDPAWKDAKDIGCNDWIQIPKAAELWLGDYGIDEGAAWLLGLFVAEGHVGTSPKGRITLSLGAHERNMAERAVREFHRLGIKNSRISQPPSIKAQNGLRVIADSVSFGSLLEKWCGMGALNKRAPQWIAHQSESIIRSFIEGVLDGDGCMRVDRRTHREYLSVSTISPVLASDITMLLVRLGICASWTASHREQQVINGRNVNCHESQCVQWAARGWLKRADKAGRPPFGAMKFINGRAFSKVTEVVRRKVSDLDVFNIHTEDETYGVPFTVHNCTDVLEHIPPNEVDKVLKNILLAAQHVFFQISCQEDSLGVLIGQPLHLSIHPYSWWLKKLQDLDCVVHWSQDEGTHCLFYVTAWQSGESFVNAGALNTTEDEILNNVRANISVDAAGPGLAWNQVSPHLTNDVEVMVLGGGPSLATFEGAIRAHRDGGVKLITTNGTYNWCLERGLTPSAQIMVDAREFNKRFVAPVVPDCKYLMSSQVHPVVMKGLPHDRTFLWHTTMENARETLNARYEIYHAIPGGSSVTLRAIPLLRMLGFRKFHLYGFDSCLSGDEHHAYSQPENDAAMVIDVTCGGRVFKCHPWMVSQAQEFMDLIKFLGDEIELEVYGDGLIAHILNTGASLSDVDISTAEVI